MKKKSKKATKKGIKPKETKPIEWANMWTHPKGGMIATTMEIDMFHDKERGTFFDRECLAIRLLRIKDDDKGKIATLRALFTSWGI